MHDAAIAGRDRTPVTISESTSRTMSDIGVFTVPDTASTPQRKALESPATSPAFPGDQKAPADTVVKPKAEEPAGDLKPSKEAETKSPWLEYFELITRPMFLAYCLFFACNTLFFNYFFVSLATRLQGNALEIDGYSRSLLVQSELS